MGPIKNIAIAVHNQTYDKINEQENSGSENSFIFYLIKVLLMMEKLTKGEYGLMNNVILDNSSGLLYKMAYCCRSTASERANLFKFDSVITNGVTDIKASPC